MNPTKIKNGKQSQTRMKNFRFRITLCNQLENVAAQERRTELAVVELALETYFNCHGYRDNRLPMEILNESAKRIGLITISKTHRLAGRFQRKLPVKNPQK